MAEGVRLELTSPKAPVFKTGGLPIILTLRGQGATPQLPVSAVFYRKNWGNVTWEMISPKMNARRYIFCRIGIQRVLISVFYSRQGCRRSQGCCTTGISPVEDMAGTAMLHAELGLGVPRRA